MNQDQLLARKLELTKLKRLAQAKLRESFDGLSPESRPTEAQLEVLKSTANINWIVASNRSGKTACGGRIVSWWFNNEHPYLERPESWGKGPLTILVVGRLQEQIESEIWEKKIKPFLASGSYTTQNIGGILKRVIHKQTGNRIIFFSHHDAVNARDKVQAFTAPIVWLDEMPTDSGIISELIMRTTTLKGYFYATFTPLIENEEIYKIVETPSKNARKFNLKILQNPSFKGREHEIEEEIRALCATEAEFRARMYGEWYRSSDRVIRVPPEAKTSLPVTYNTGWRHFALVDPAASGLVGFLVLAEDPSNGTWYTVKAKYLQGAAAFDLVKQVEEELKGLNVKWRVCDCNPAGFYKEAHRVGILWQPYSDKAGRKVETIEKTNETLARLRIRLTSAADLLESETARCKWSETDDKIKKASRYHLIDCLRYFVDLLPEFKPFQNAPLTASQAVRREWHRQRDERFQKEKAKELKRFKVLGGRSRLWT